MEPETAKPLPGPPDWVTSKAEVAAHAGIRPDDIERAIWLIEDLEIYFRELAESETNKHAAQVWRVLYKHYGRAAQYLSGLLAEGRITVTELESGRQAQGADGHIILDHRLDGAWDPARVARSRRVGGDDWTFISRLSAVLLQQFGRVQDNQSQIWIDEQRRRSRVFRSGPAELEGSAAAALLQLGYLKDRFALISLLIETASHMELKATWGRRRSALEQEAKDFLDRHEAQFGPESRQRLASEWWDYRQNVRRFGLSWARRDFAVAAPIEPRPSERIGASDRDRVLGRKSAELLPAELASIFERSKGPELLLVRDLQGIAAPARQPLIAATDAASRHQTTVTETIIASEAGATESMEGVDTAFMIIPSLTEASTSEPITPADPDLFQPAIVPWTDLEATILAQAPLESDQMLESAADDPLGRRTKAATDEPLSERLAAEAAPEPTAGPVQVEPGRVAGPIASASRVAESSLPPHLGPDLMVSPTERAAIDWRTYLASPESAEPDTASRPEAGETASLAAVSRTESSQQGSGAQVLAEVVAHKDIAAAFPQADLAAPVLEPMLEKDAGDVVDEREPAERTAPPGSPPQPSPTNVDHDQGPKRTHQPSAEEVAALAWQEYLAGLEEPIPEPKESPSPVHIAEEDTALLLPSAEADGPNDALAAVEPLAPSESEAALLDVVTADIASLQNWPDGDIAEAIAIEGVSAIQSYGMPEEKEVAIASLQANQVQPAVTEPDDPVAVLGAAVESKSGPGPKLEFEPPSGDEAGGKPQTRASPAAAVEAQVAPGVNPSDESHNEEPLAASEPRVAMTAGDKSVQPAPPYVTTPVEAEAARPIETPQPSAEAAKTEPPSAIDKQEQSSETVASVDHASTPTPDRMPQAISLFSDSTRVAAVIGFALLALLSLILFWQRGLMRSAGASQGDKSESEPATAKSEPVLVDDPAPDGVTQVSNADEVPTATTPSTPVTFETAVVTWHTTPPVIRVSTTPRDDAPAATVLDSSEPEPLVEPQEAVTGQETAAATEENLELRQPLQTLASQAQAEAADAEDTVPDASDDTEEQETAAANSARPSGSRIVEPQIEPPSEPERTHFPGIEAEAEPASAVAFEHAVEDVKPQQLVEALREGNLAQFKAHFAALTGLHPLRVDRIIYATGGEDVAIACRALGVEKLLFASLFLLIRKQCLGETQVLPHLFSKIMALYDEVSVSDAQGVLRKWRKDRNSPGVRERLEEAPQEGPARDDVARAFHA